jgi:hypothetical protein
MMWAAVYLLTAPSQQHAGNMIKFYTNQELSQALDINLARWKRWSREFLPPDPLGGLQSGYARQYNVDQAFTVYLGGFLVGELKYTIPQARRILLDLRSWLVTHQFYTDYSRHNPPGRENSPAILYYQIAVGRSAAADNAEPGFFYVIRGVMADEFSDVNGIAVRQERYVESTINLEISANPMPTAAGYCVLNISTLRNRFLTSLTGSATAA